ncbi:MAG: hypothetical protein ACYTF5_00830, partial [Planctomycetota bacterium]
MKSAPHLLLPLLLGLPMLQAQKLPDEFHTIQGETIQGRLLAADDKGNLRVRREGREGADEPGLLQLSALRTIRLGGRGRSNGVALGLVTLRTGLTLPATIE